MRSSSWSAGRAAVATAMVALATVSFTVAGSSVEPALAAGITTVDIFGDPENEQLGFSVTVLANGNYVVTDPGFDGPGEFDVGAVYLYDGMTDAVISTLTGASRNQAIGSSRVVEVGDSNFILVNSAWRIGLRTVGAVTWINGTVGLSGFVTEQNSLVGSTHNDFVGSAIEVLTNGNYVVVSSYWRGPGGGQVGAVTWANGNSGITGVVGPGNSLVGSLSGDVVGSAGVTSLANGNYVVQSSNWNRGSGAATWASGSAPTTGFVSADNSLVGSSIGDSVGGSAIALTNGNYVVASPDFDRLAPTRANAGAVTFGNGATGTKGFVNAANSLLGTSASDRAGGDGVTPLRNGNYVVNTSSWDNGATQNVGASTWGNGTTGTVGNISPANSVIGSNPNDQVSLGDGIFYQDGSVALSNGNYVVNSPQWGDGIARRGAVTWASGTTATTGVVGVTNSLVGATADDRVGAGSIAPLSNGNYVVASPFWDGSVADVGAATWASGSGPTTGLVSASNSLIGSSSGDRVGGEYQNITALMNGNYVVGSPTWANGSAAAAGAATWGNGATGTTGTVSPANSIVGSSAGDQVGLYRSATLPNGNYVVLSPMWDGAAADTGAVTWAPGTGPAGLAVSAANSVVGSTAVDRVGDGEVTVFSDSSFVLTTGMWDNGAIVSAGAAIYADPYGLIPGPITSANAVIGGRTSGVMSVGRRRTSGDAIVIGRRVENRFTLLRDTPVDFVPLAPARLADSRAGTATIDGLAAGGGLLPAGSTFELPVRGRGGVSTDAPAVSLNVTVTEAIGPGFVTVYPCGESRPTASNLNVVAGSTVPNAVIARIGAAGSVCFFTQAAAHLVVDVGGYFPSESTYRSLNPGRVLETRPGLPTVDGAAAGAGPVPAGVVTSVRVTGRAGVPVDATSVVLNVTAVDPSGPGFVTVYPCGAPRPLASSLNYATGAVVPALVVSKVGVGGDVCLFAPTSTHLVVDVNGYLPATTSYRSLNPARLLESRVGQATIDGGSSGLGVRLRGTVTAVRVLGRGDVSTDAGTVVLNVTVTETAGPGFVTVYPCGIERPLASNLNYATGVDIANAVVVKVGNGGEVCLFNSEATHLVVDVVGAFPETSPP